MIAEVIAAVIVGAIALGLVLEPLIRSSNGRVAVEIPDMVDPEDTPRGAALAALKEIEFDRATGKLSDSDYHLLNTQYTAKALEATRAEDREAQMAAARSAPSPSSGSPDEIEAIIAAKVRAIRSGAGAGTEGLSCPACGPRPEPDAIFCSNCGSRLPTGASCGGCGAPLTPDGRFCEGCGRKVAA